MFESPTEVLVINQFKFKGETKMSKTRTIQLYNDFDGVPESTARFALGSLRSNQWLASKAKYGRFQRDLMMPEHTPMGWSQGFTLNRASPTVTVYFSFEYDWESSVDVEPYIFERYAPNIRIGFSSGGGYLDAQGASEYLHLVTEVQAWVSILEREFLGDVWTVLNAFEQPDMSGSIVSEDEARSALSEGAEVFMIGKARWAKDMETGSMRTGTANLEYGDTRVVKINRKRTIVQDVDGDFWVCNNEEITTWIVR